MFTKRMPNNELGMKIIGLSILILAFMYVPLHAQDEAPGVTAFPNAPGWITIVWEHSGDYVYSFVVERQSPPYDDNSIVAVAILNSPTRQFTDMNLQAETTYNHRVCAVYDYHRTCSEWVRTVTLSSQSQKKPSTPPPAKTPPPLSTPVLKVTAAGTRNILLEWDYNYEERLTSMALYRDDQFIFDGTVSGGFVSRHTDVVPRFNTEYTYKLCFTNPDEKDKCSEPVKVMGTAIAPTAPADLQVSKIQLSGGSALGGALQLRPRPTLSLTWRNTDVPGQFITVEALDTIPSYDTMLDGAVTMGPKKVWYEATRVAAKNDPTSLNVGVVHSIISAEMSLKTYRICSVVPVLGDSGKVCSQPVSIQ